MRDCLCVNLLKAERYRRDGADKASQGSSITQHSVRTARDQSGLTLLFFNFRALGSPATISRATTQAQPAEVLQACKVHHRL